MCQFWFEASCNQDQNHLNVHCTQCTVYKHFQGTVYAVQSSLHNYKKILTVYQLPILGICFTAMISLLTFWFEDINFYHWKRRTSNIFSQVPFDNWANEVNSVELMSRCVRSFIWLIWCTKRRRNNSWSRLVGGADKFLLIKENQTKGKSSIKTEFGENA